MINILLCFTLLITSAPISDWNNQLTVFVTGINNDSGQLIVSLHSDPSTFPKKNIAQKYSSIVNGKSIITFNNIPNGIYAVSVLHDENNNGKIDFNFLHIPTEKTAASNNAKGFFGPPDFEDAKFIVDRDMELTISFK
jgi:uncharacterized protein (DUF2141 family)